MYTVICTYKNHITGETRTFKADKAYKTKRGADAYAKSFSMVVMPDGKTATAEYSAEVIQS